MTDTLSAVRFQNLSEPVLHKYRNFSERNGVLRLLLQCYSRKAVAAARQAAPVFAPEVQVNLRGGENGYFSSHQAYYLLDTYLRSRRLANLSFTTIGESDVNPYATGGANLLYRGNKDYVQVYVALSLTGGRWVISRINIY